MENRDVSLHTDAALKQRTTHHQHDSRKVYSKLALSTIKEVLLYDKHKRGAEDDLDKCCVEDEDFSGLSLNHLLHAQPKDITVCWKTKSYVDADGDGNKIGGKNIATSWSSQRKLMVFTPSSVKLTKQSVTGKRKLHSIQ